jgi:hypothetical protein
VMFSIYIPVFLREPLRWTSSTVVDLLLPFQLLRLKQVMYLLIFQQTLFLLQMVKSSWKLNSSIKVLDQPSMSVFPSVESDLLPRLRLWNKLLVQWSSILPNTEKSPLSLNSVPILMLLPNSFY